MARAPVRRVGWAVAVLGARGGRAGRTRAAALFASGGSTLAAFALSTVALGAAAAGVAGQQAVRSLDLAKDEFTEERLPRRQVSGASRAGVLAGPLVDSVDPSRLVLRIPPGAEGMLCVNIRSANGEYLGRIRRSVDGLAPGDYQVAVPTDEAPFFLAHDANEIAVLAFVAESCLGVRPRMILPASWSGAIEEDGFWVFLLLGGRHRASVVVTDANEERQAFPCEPVPVRQPVTYSHRCRVAVPAGGVREASVDVRAGLRDRLDPIPLPIRW